jgi:hypothetical protein
MDYTTLHYTTLHYTTLHYTTSSRASDTPCEYIIVPIPKKWEILPDRNDSHFLTLKTEQTELSLPYII